jgi:hypothetical protein
LYKQHLHISFIFFLLFFGLKLSAQPFVNLVQKKIPVTDTSLIIDFRSIIPGSLSIKNIAQANYHLDEINARLTWITQPELDSVYIEYRVFHKKLNAPVYRMQYDSIRYFFLAEKPVKSSQFTRTSDDFFVPEDGKIKANGSIGRIITVGNNQDAVINSNLNLQLSGYLSDSMELILAISENASPIQPNGNTRDLRDLDRIFMQVAKSNWKVQLGDLDLKENRFSYLNFYKRVQGISYVQQADIPDQWKTQTHVTGSVAKGRFNRQMLEIIEGNQGPYRLRGANNELFFQVLSGTEKVFIDGVRVFRGEDQDYVINYNTAEISFTPKQFITKDKRIQVEFEYTDRNYLNTQWYLNQSFEKRERSKWNLAFFSNQDSRNNPIDRVLDNRQKLFLSKLGDRFEEAFWPNAMEEIPGEGKFLYKKIDTTWGNNQHDSIYVLSSDTTHKLFNLSFSYVGPGNGNYQPLLNGANGKVFYWIEPDSLGNKKGNYEPVDFIVTPKRLQLLMLSNQLELGKSTQFRSEWALSRYDVNLFASSNKGNDWGYAGKMELEKRTDTFKTLGQSQILHVKLGAEWVSPNFKTVERYRTVEFYRDWGLPVILNQVEEKWGNMDLALIGKNKGETRYQLSQYQRGDGYRGVRHQLNQQYAINNWHWNIQLQQTSFQQSGSKGRFFRPVIDLKKQWNKQSMEWGIQYLLEDNRIQDRRTDSILIQSFSFDRTEAYVRSAGKTAWNLRYFTRRDRLPNGTGWKEIDQSHNYLAGLDWNTHPIHQISINAGFRNLANKDATRAIQPDEKTLLSRLNWNFSPWKGFVQGNLFYETGGGQEQKREFSYLAVPAGQGEFTWIDYNGNGVEELNEFERALFPDQRKYIRIFTPSNDIVRAQFVQLNYRLDITPSRLFVNQENKFNKWISKFQLSSSLQLNRRSLAGKNFILHPLKEINNDTLLISRLQNQSHSIFYQRTDTRWGLEITQTDNRSTALLNYGLEENLQTVRFFRGRVGLSNSLRLEFLGKLQVQELNTKGDLFQNRNYRIIQQQLEPQISYVHKNKWRSNWNLGWSGKENKLDRTQQLEIWNAQWEIKYNAPSDGSIRAQFLANRVITNASISQLNTTAGFILLDGWRPGTNYRWTLDWVKRIGKTWEVNIYYEGRKPDGTRLIHTGRASVRAIF